MAGFDLTTEADGGFGRHSTKASSAASGMSPFEAPNLGRRAFTEASLPPWEAQFKVPS
jgi:hypothetical protein